ncbi:MAG: FapA family protein [Carboxydocellales bacterium]
MNGQGQKEVVVEAENPADGTEKLQPQVEYLAEADEATDGSVNIKDGVVLVADPQLGGRFPVITPSENTIITVNDERISEPTVVSSEDHIWVGTAQSKPEQKVEIEVTEDKLTAYLKILRFPGGEYIVEDSTHTLELKPRARLIKVVPPVPVTRKDVETIAQMSGITYGLDLTDIERAIDDVDSAETKIIIARGKPPVDVRSGKIVLRFNQGSPIWGINPYGKGLVNSVEEGMDIYGNPIPPLEAVEMKPIAKDGAQIVQNGTIAAALIARRPAVERKHNNIFRVIPVHTVHGDVDISIGNFKFKGDIHILGSVLDGFRVEAGGNIKVYGSVIHAELLAGGSVEVGKNIISSKVTTGGQAVIFKLVEPLLKEIRNNYKKLDGLGSLRIKESKELALLVQSIDELFREIEDLIAAPSDVHADYIQNSWIKASGDIVISGAGSIISNLNAGRDIIINNDYGVVRGGQLTAHGLVKLKEVGSSSEAAVTINLLGNSKLEADFIHPIVIVEHGAQKYRFETRPARYVEAYANKEGKLVFNKLNSKG